MERPGWVSKVLTFWFEELTPEDWFTVNEATDATIRQRFAALHGEVSGKPPKVAASDADTALATVIVLDQFPRNLFRRSAEAFATDALALETARTAVANGLDKELPDRRWMFLYMPFMHSEALADQERCVALLEARGAEDLVKHAVEHRDIIERFGRFPHRNRVLGRAPTAEETAFLEGHEGFGQ